MSGVRRNPTLSRRMRNTFCTETENNNTPPTGRYQVCCHGKTIRTNAHATRMHSSRMRTVHSSSHLLGGLPQCMLGYPPPGCGPGDTPPPVWAWRQPQARPLNFPPGFWAWRPARHAGIPTPPSPPRRPARHAGIPAAMHAHVVGLECSTLLLIVVEILVQSTTSIRSTMGTCTCFNTDA